MARRKVAEGLHSTAIHLLRRLRRVDDASGLGPARLSALSVLVFGGSCTLGELAAAEGVKPPTMTRLIQSLEAEGLVARSPSLVDRRVTMLRATPEGKRRMLQGRERRLRVFTALLTTATPKELDTLTRATSILDRLLSEPQDRKSERALSV